MIYLDNAATTFPKPNIVCNSVINCITNYCANPGRGSHNLSLKCELEIYKCREQIAKLINSSDPLNIIFTKNATEALNIAIKGTLLNGDHVLTSAIEHNSVLRPLEYLKNLGVEVTTLPVSKDGYVVLDSLKKSIKKNTKAIIINHGSNVLGNIQDIKEIGLIAKKNGLLFIVDGSQTIGFCDMDVVNYNVDLLAFPAHKALFGIQGTGCLYIRSGLKLNPILQGGTGSNSHSVIQPDFLPDSLESGTLNTPGIIALLNGINFILETELVNIRKHEIELMTFLTSELKKLPYVKIYGEINPSIKTPVLSFNIDRFDSSEVGNLLNNRDICVRTSYHCAPLIHEIIGTEKIGTVRVSPGYFNTINHIESFVIAIKEIYNL